MTARASRNHLRGRLAHFADVLIPDGCGFKLAKALSGVYAGIGVPAQMKLHAVYSVAAGDCVSAKATAGSVHDSDEFWPNWESEALYIRDLSYQGVDRFVDAALSGAHVLQRLKDTHNLQVLASYGPTGARRALDDGEGGPVRIEEALAIGNNRIRRSTPARRPNALRDRAPAGALAPLPSGHDPRQRTR